MPNDLAYRISDLANAFCMADKKLQARIKQNLAILRDHTNSIELIEAAAKDTQDQIEKALNKYSENLRKFDSDGNYVIDKDEAIAYDEDQIVSVKKPEDRVMIPLEWFSAAKNSNQR